MQQTFCKKGTFDKTGYPTLIRRLKGPDVRVNS